MEEKECGIENASLSRSVELSHFIGDIQEEGSCLLDQRQHDVQGNFSLTSPRLGELYSAEKKSFQLLLSSTQAGQVRKVKQEQEDNSRNHVQAFFPGSVLARTVQSKFLSGRLC